MTATTPPSSHSLRCYITVDFDCSYLPGRRARNLVLDPDVKLNSALLGELLNQGFRRSGDHLYRPHCDQCQACLPLRIPVDRFTPTRNQRRCLRNNVDLDHHAHPASFNQAHFELYRRYLNQRHPESSMANPSEEEYLSFLCCEGVDTWFHEFRLDEQLVAVAVTDHVPLGLSAVYTFFEPEMAPRSLGTYAILWQIQAARRLGLPWLYLGYWIEESPAMRYKSRFRPAEYFKNGGWTPLI